mgnify:FL=1
MNVTSLARAHIPEASPDHSRPICRQITQALSRVGDKWVVGVIVLLEHRSRRFSELKRDLGNVSPRMLTLTLRNLERDGLVRRLVTPVIPPRVDYELTSMGFELAQALNPLERWAYANLSNIDQAQQHYDALQEA